MKPQLLIAAAASGSGKTTFTMGLLRAWQRKGLQVQPFKCGPDYIDTQFHSLASGRPSVNLDLWMASRQHVSQLYVHYGKDSDACVIEGVMGLCDGYNRQQGSAADIAALLQVPVVLLVNAKSAAYSVAPLIYGFKHFCKEVNLAGVVFNQVGSESHYTYLKEACEDVGVPCLGYLRKCKDMEVPSRHLGLSLENREVMEAWINQAADLVEEHVDLELLAKLCSMPEPAGEPLEFPAFPSIGKHIAIARDEAFNFTYRANLDALEHWGKVAYFSPLHDEQLPPQTDFLYLPGGYPELYIEALSQNQSMLASIRAYAQAGGKILAECGGMIYLGQSLLQDQKEYPLLGILPLKSSMDKARLHLGYRVAEIEGKNWKGHEFHYSDIAFTEPCTSAVQLFNAKGAAVGTHLFLDNQLCAGYTHWYFFS